MQKLSKIQNNRYMNQNIYRLFIMGSYDECLALIDRCKQDEFKLYIKSLIMKYTFQLEKSLVLLN